MPQPIKIILYHSFFSFFDLLRPDEQELLLFQIAQVQIPHLIPRELQIMWEIESGIHCIEVEGLCVFGFFRIWDEFRIVTGCKRRVAISQMETDPLIRKMISQTLEEQKGLL